MFRMKQKVRIKRDQKTDGRFNAGTIIGIAMEEGGAWLGYTSEKEFLARFNRPTYKVAYVDCVTERACTEWFDEPDLEKK